jgi:phosphoribosylanthranilate isomerase
MNELKIKVCGMRDPENISGVVNALPDFMGFIFYPKSKRFVGVDFSPEILKIIPGSIKKVGVFVNEIQENIIEICQRTNLEVVQLHGNESPEFCHLLKLSGLTVFKAFSVDEQFDFEKLNVYSEACDYFLFDTKGELPGGTGQKFNWKMLERYEVDVPFFLSGGIGLDDLEAIRQFSHPRWCGLDVNSGFEISPAMKNVEKIKKFIDQIRKSNTKTQSH